MAAGAKYGTHTHTIPRKLAAVLAATALVAVIVPGNASAGPTDNLVEFKWVEAPAAMTWFTPTFPDGAPDAGLLTITMTCRDTGCSGTIVFKGVGTMLCSFNEDGSGTGNMEFGLTVGGCDDAFATVNPSPVAPEGFLCSGKAQVTAYRDNGDFLMHGRGGGIGFGEC